MSYLPGTSYYIELEHIIENIKDDSGNYLGKGKFGRKKQHKLLKQKIIEFNEDNGGNIFIEFPRFSKLLVEAFDNNSLNNTHILLEFGADLNYGDQTTIFNNIVNSMISKISALINKNNKYLSIEKDLENIINNLMILPDDNNYDEMDELIELLEDNNYDENLIQEIIDVAFEDSTFEIELERISKILIYGSYSKYSAPYGLSYSLSINELLNLYYKFFKIYLNYDIDYDKGENNFEFFTGDNEMNDEENDKKAIQLVLLELEKAKFNLIKGKQMLEFSKISQMTNIPYGTFPIDLLEKISNINTRIDENVIEKIKSEEENQMITDYLDTINQYGSGRHGRHSGKSSKSKRTKKRLYRFY